MLAKLAAMVAGLERIVSTPKIVRHYQDGESPITWQNGPSPWDVARKLQQTPRLSRDQQLLQLRNALLKAQVGCKDAARRVPDHDYQQTILAIGERLAADRQAIERRHSNRVLRAVDAALSWAATQLFPQSSTPPFPVQIPPDYTNPYLSVAEKALLANRLQQPVGAAYLLGLAQRLEEAAQRERLGKGQHLLNAAERYRRMAQRASSQQ